MPAPGITGGFSGIDALNDNAGGGTLAGENLASTWILAAAVSDASNYNDGAHSLGFSGFSTLDGGTAADVFHLAGGAAGYTITGGGASSGVDELTGASDAVLTGSTASGFSGTANGGAAPTGVSFSQISDLQGSGSLTGEDTTSTWTLGSPATYFDGSYTLDFSGFSTLNGSGTDTLANVADATLTSSGSSGFSGTADSPSVSFSGMTTLDGNGSASLTNAEGTASTWTIYASSDNSTYNDGSYNLTFSGFTTLER